MQRTNLDPMQLIRRATGLLCLALLTLSAHASNGAAAFTAVSTGSSSNTSATFASSPIVSIQSATPFAMIAMSRDQTLDKKAYDDYTDLNGDGVPDVGYENAIAYFGYFDPSVCYTYNGTYFIPKEFTDSNYHCNLNGTTNEWSGNFLDWASMTRMDELRKILFGGVRSTDGTGASGITILRRQFLPNDGHSFVKYYNGTDVNQLMPFNLANGKYGTTDGSSSAGHCTDTTGQKCGVSLCNTTAPPLGGSNLFSEQVSQTTYPPLIRAAFGNYSLWASSERTQCRWGEELQTLSSGNNTGANSNQGSNGNVPASSGIYAYAYSPFKAATSGSHTPANAPAAALTSTDSYGPDFGVLVQTCVANLTTSAENCKQYPLGDSKPIGLFQLYGDQNEMDFGMMAGSYTSNKEGGTLVKNVGTINDEVDATGDGHFKEYYITGTCAAASCAGMINAISLYTLVGYNFSDGTYNDNDSDGVISGCSWGLNTFSNGNCTNWGNPFAEIYLNSVRYLAGLGVSGAFQANDSAVITGLVTDSTSQWADPLSASTRCTSLNVIAFNSSSISYDANNLDGSAPATPGVKEIWAGTDITTMTNAVGTGEGLAGQYFFGGTWTYGTNTFSGDGLCTAKNFASLSAVNGVCPDAPRLQGSYNIAGIAYWAHTHDIRSSGSNALTGNQLVTTYSVALATGTPIMQIPVPSSSKTITIIPACQNSTVGGNCAIVDFKIVAQNRAAGTGSFYVNWEDSEQGGDYDEDAWGIINYTIAAGKITVSTDAIAVSTPYAMAFGFVIAGTTQDGFHAYSGVNSYSYTDTYSGIPHCNSCNVSDGAVSYAFTIGTSSGQSLQDPLWYAAKYGAFQDQNANSLPDLPGEWDCYNSDGNKNTNCGGSETPDGIPDTYYKANNPSALYASLQRAFQSILAKTASGTAAAVVANARQGNGAVYQALYEPLHQDIHGNAVSWLGTLYSLFVDQFGNLREDGNHDRMMGTYAIDPIVSIFFDPVNNVTEFRRYLNCDPTAVQISTCSTIVLPLDQLNTVWDARDQLASLTPTQAATQRVYASALANTGRYIFTWLGARSSGGTPTTVDFLPATFTSSNLGYLNPDLTGTPTPTAATELTQAQSIVSWVRGVEQTGMRSRTVDYFNNGTYLVERLGDIVNSTPTVVAEPQEAFDILYSDTSFLTFRTHWLNRRTVVYVGANDGMLHAFNGGFFNPSTTSFDLTSGGGSGSELQHPLGSELWAYAPMDLLPHLKWLTQQNYPHVYYMDAKPRVFDAKIFSADTDHPGGWGTVLVIGMRFGGGPICINTAATSLATCPTTGSSVINPPSSLPATVTLQSAYVLMDITNPEVPPVLMDEFFVPTSLASSTPVSISAFTTSYPTLSTFRKTDNSVNKWYLVFGSGPTDLQNAISNQDAQFFVYDLTQYATGTIGTKLVKDYDLSGSTQAFTGDPVSVDWDLNFYDNAVFFGTCGNTAASPMGSIYRLGVDETPAYTSWAAPQVLLGLPSSSTTPTGYQCETPTMSVVLDPNKNPWLYFGTGRFYVNADKTSSTQQAFYGIKDRNASTTASVGSSPITTDTLTKLVDVSNAQVTTLGVLSGVSTYLGGGSLGSSPTKVTTLQTLMTTGATNPDGWVLNFPASSVVTTVSPVPTTRNVSETSVIGGIFFGTAYSPDPDLCAAEGLSSLYGVFYLTGTPISTAQVFGQDSTHTYVLSNVSLGAGLASSPSLQIAKGLGNSQAEIYTQTSTGAIVQTGATLANNTTSGEISWQQPNQ